MDDIPVVYAQPFNRGFVEGKRRRIKGASGRDWIFGFVVGIPMILFLWYFLSQAQTASTVTARGIEVHAVIAERTYHSHTRGSGYDYYVSYAYIVNGQTHRSREKVSSDLYYGLQIGAEVTVRYLPEDPGVARLSGRFAASSPLDSAFWWFLFLLIAVVLIIVVQEWDSLRYSARGQVIDGTLDRVTVTRWRGNREATFEYHFRSPSGTKLTGRTSARRNDLEVSTPPKRSARKLLETMHTDLDGGNPLPQRGSPVKVLYIDDKYHRML